jgi:hypothetical protein
VMGAAAPVTNKGSRGAGTVSNRVAEAVATVALGEGRMGHEFSGTNIGAEDRRWFPAYDLEACAVWVIKGPHNAAAMATVSGISCGAAEPPWWGKGLATFAHRVFHEFRLEGRGGGKVTIVVVKAWDTVEHDGGKALIGDAPAVRTQVSK